jgi:uncharacterized protein (DUF362 family)
MKPRHHNSIIKLLYQILETNQSQEYKRIYQWLTTNKRFLILPKYTENPDYIKDIYIDPWYWKKTYDLSGKNLTSLQHFTYCGFFSKKAVDLEKYQGYLWDEDPSIDILELLGDILGTEVFYNPKTSKYMNEEILKKSPANKKLKEKGDIDDIIFPSSLELAEFYGQEAIKQFRDKKEDLGLKCLGFCLHMIQDSTCPHHLLNMLLEGHPQWEKQLYLRWKLCLSTETPNKRKKWIQKIGKYLTEVKEEYLNLNSFEDILKKNLELTKKALNQNGKEKYKEAIKGICDIETMLDTTVYSLASIIQALNIVQREEEYKKPQIGKISPGPGIKFKETMKGFIKIGSTDPIQGFDQGKEEDTEFILNAEIIVDDIDKFITLSSRTATLKGKVNFAPLGKDMEIQEGKFNLFSTLEGKRKMIYDFLFLSEDNNTYRFKGEKFLVDEPWEFDLLADMTTLYSKIYNGEGKQIAAGILKFELSDGAQLLTSMEVTNAKTRCEKMRAMIKFFSFIYKETRNEYFQNNSLVYRTGYENLVLSGRLKDKRSFIFFSGAHDIGFPWGDGSTFWDIGLTISENKNKYTQYIISDRCLQGLRIDIEHGSYTYRGPIYKVINTDNISFLDDIKRPNPKVLKPAEIRIKLKFTPLSLPIQDILFPIKLKLGKEFTDEMRMTIRNWLPHLNSLGIRIIPYKIHLTEATIELKEDGVSTYIEIDYSNSLGNAEIGDFTLPKEPTIKYNYILGLNQKKDIIYTKIDSGIWRNERHIPLKDMIDKFLGDQISLITSKGWYIQGDNLQDKANSKLDSLSLSPVFTLELDHYPTGVFQRKIVKLKDNSGEEFLGLEESMRHINLASINSKKESLVVCLKSSKSSDIKPEQETEDKKRLLDQVIEEAKFFDNLERRYQESRKKREDFSIIIKPNFMFLYHKMDITTYTDPILLEHLIDRIYEKGFRNIAIAEARSTYGVYFQNREVRKVAEYIGLKDNPKYKVIDLSEDLVEYKFQRPLFRYPVNRQWKEADYRISFAKNKTHTYTFYTLTIKNIYGALPSENKFKEYHSNPKLGIYEPTIEFLRAFPVHFGFIDAYVSADGAFGIFVDKIPEKTYTLIGGEDLVAVDWVAASKMGLNPMMSKYMVCAVREFGKPRIRLKGDESLYKKWANVSWELTRLLKEADRRYKAGALLFHVLSYQDQEAFPPKDAPSYIKFLRKLADPIREIVFLQKELQYPEITRILSKILYRLPGMD